MKKMYLDRLLLGILFGSALFLTSCEAKPKKNFPDPVPDTTRVVTLDTEVPTVNITAPSGDSVAGIVTITANASDNVRVTGVQFLIDGNTVVPVNATPPSYSYSWNTATFVRGDHFLTVRARDARGNIGTSKDTFNVLRPGSPVNGGILFSVSDDGRGLMVSAQDIGNIRWFPPGTSGFLGTTETRFGSGRTNTDHIIQGVGGSVNYAALACSNLRDGNYSDWYLPSRDELSLLYSQRAVIPILSGVYWSSSEINSQGAYSQTFNDNTMPQSRAKTLTSQVRAIRIY